MKRPYYIFSNGRLRRRQNTLLLERTRDVKAVPDDPFAPDHPTGEPEVERIPFPIEQVESLHVFGEVDINTKLVTFLAQQGVPVLFFDYYGNYTSTLYPREPIISGRLRVEQVRHYLNRKRRMTIARRIVDGAIFNILRVLKYYTQRADDDGAEAISEAVDKIEVERCGLADADDVPTLMGIEGRARDIYYRAWPCILGPVTTSFPFDKRQRRPPSNEINALISFGNALCYSAVLRQIYRTALDPTVSYLHEPGDRRFSLALDVSEIFKPLLVDRGIFRLLKTREISPRHFEERLGGVYLTEKGRRIFVEHWDERMRSTIKHRSLGRNVSYERLIRLECHRLVRHLTDPRNDPYKPFKMWW
jgi:CRISP-associated protein Cas1